MCELDILHDSLYQFSPELHLKRLNSLTLACHALLDCKTLTLTELGRNLPTKARTKHNIKRIDRLLGNRHLHKERLAGNFQTIIFASQTCKLESEILVLDINSYEAKGFGSIFYKNNDADVHQARLQKTVTKLKPGYHLGAKLKKDENLDTEYKEVKGNNAVNSIKDVADQYIVAFLNSPQLKQGRILWGVTDSNREVVGVSLNYSQRDDLRRNLVNKLHDIQPTIPPSCYRVEFKPVYLKNKPVDDLYVLEVSVRPFESEFLFCTTKKEVFVKTDGGKRKLTPYEIQLEYRNRIKKYN